MLMVNSRQIRGLLMLAIALFGLAAGYCAAQFSGWLLMPADGDYDSSPARTARPVDADSFDVEVILRGNIFDPSARGRGEQKQLAAGQARTVQATAGNLHLHGTIEGGDDPLALIEAAGKVVVYRPGDRLPGGGALYAVERSRVLIRAADGHEVELRFEKSNRSGTVSRSPRATRASGREPSVSGIRSLGGNRWEISRSEVDQARSNLSSLLKQARMEPHVVNGQTDGFVVRMIRPRSLLAKLGMRVGDVVSAVNGVELDSPEKALQIFQQLREAKKLTVDLTRGQERMTFEYEVN